MSKATNQIRLGGSIFDPDLGVVLAPDGTRAELRPKTAALLRALAKEPGVVVSKDALIEEVWSGRAVDDDGLVQCVGEIRRSLGPSGREAVRTHARRGYSLHTDPLPHTEPAPPKAAVRGAWTPTIAVGLAVATVGAAVATSLHWTPSAPASVSPASTPAPSAISTITLAIDRMLQA